MRWALISAAVGVGLYGVHRLATYADRKGWIYYRTKPPAGAGSRAIMRATAVFDPTIEHVIEEVESDRLVVDESGAPPRLVVDEGDESPRTDELERATNILRSGQFPGVPGGRA